MVSFYRACLSWSSYDLLSSYVRVIVGEGGGGGGGGRERLGETT